MDDARRSDARQRRRDWKSAAHIYLRDPLNPKNARGKEERVISDVYVSERIVLFRPHACDAINITEPVGGRCISGDVTFHLRPQETGPIT